MTFSQLHERLRLEMWRRIERGVLSGKLLAQQTGLRPSHISNFLHRKRRLSLIALDRLLDAQKLTVQELAAVVQPGLESRGGHPAAAPELAIPLISQMAAMHSAAILPRAAQGYIVLPAGTLDGVRARRTPARRTWQRFVAIRVTAEQAPPMHPLLRAFSIVVIDRHYNSLVPVQPPHPNLYALTIDRLLAFRYLTFEAGRLILRPYDFDSPIDAIELPPYESPSDLIVGRICLCLTAT
jgi:Cro/C1-type HTH DNA-binding domain